MPRPAKKDLEVYQGDDHSWPIAVKNRTGDGVHTPFDLTGYTFQAHIRTDVADSDTDVDAVLTFTVNPDPAMGELVMHLSSEASKVLDLPRYKWDLQMTRTADDYITTLLYGTVIVSREVTRP